MAALLTIPATPRSWPRPEHRLVYIVAQQEAGPVFRAALAHGEPWLQVLWVLQLWLCPSPHVCPGVGVGVAVFLRQLGGALVRDG